MARPFWTRPTLVLRCQEGLTSLYIDFGLSPDILNGVISTRPRHQTQDSIDTRGRRGGGKWRVSAYDTPASVGLKS